VFDKALHNVVKLKRFEGLRLQSLDDKFTNLEKELLISDDLLGVGFPTQEK
jgi:hypothetical protein